MSGYKRKKKNNQQDLQGEGTNYRFYYRDRITNKDKRDPERLFRETLVDRCCGVLAQLAVLQQQGISTLKKTLPSELFVLCLWHIDFNKALYKYNKSVKKEKKKRRERRSGQREKRKLPTPPPPTTAAALQAYYNALHHDIYQLQQQQLQQHQYLIQTQSPRQYESRKDLLLKGLKYGAALIAGYFLIAHLLVFFRDLLEKF